ncbi:MAG: bifunctional DNA-formamidopyrimidine glycosylase/DNA-(apurinic or apyrimidinic site) lyase [Actinomycetota bacterium]|nr:bifunctional DNA-formamidopyrimidine glycosylase/DNA-(apurinic or apyrimidinic site) lyase [Solirubrobacterales bacterium]MDQ3371473.1 bifunctional DNA-formamidopyrimidine glycosylase/DNA-(apurinic or apyrimidinic site) lyase [Actinomycetota bacterium]MDQ3409194.1 bifunctional DNA-formamidopyrimidine glycosylase/DNA-(apurinic or apyrimidinic site) lyase [Actinomycetota bacterium]
MPELPEVETIRRQLSALVEERRLEALTVADARWCAPLDPREVEAAVAGRTVRALSRRGKYLTWELERDVFLVCHLRMTGTMLYDPPPDQDPPHARVTFLLEDCHRVVFCDPRRFGTGELLLGSAALEAFYAARLGVEPLSVAFTAAHLRALARGRRAPVKAFLLDQTKVAGVGNIYADEALFRARIHPLRPAGALRGHQLGALRDAVVAVLEAGIDAGGATIDDFRHADGVRGSFQHAFLVHRRAGEPCAACGTPIRKLVAAGRGTYVCERCQPVPRRRSR